MAEDMSIREWLREESDETLDTLTAEEEELAFDEAERAKLNYPDDVRFPPDR